MPTGDAYIAGRVYTSEEPAEHDFLLRHEQASHKAQQKQGAHTRRTTAQHREKTSTQTHPGKSTEIKRRK